MALAHRRGEVGRRGGFGRRQAIRAWWALHAQGHAHLLEQAPRTAIILVIAAAVAADLAVAAAMAAVAAAAAAVATANSGRRQRRHHCRDGVPQGAQQRLGPPPLQRVALINVVPPLQGAAALPRRRDTQVMLCGEQKNNGSTRRRGQGRTMAGMADHTKVMPGPARLYPRERKMPNVAGSPTAQRGRHCNNGTRYRPMNDVDQCSIVSRRSLLESYWALTAW